jgi:tRNA(Ile)-lysidine synthase
MTQFSPKHLLEFFQAELQQLLQQEVFQFQTCFLAYSGGRDSRVLLELCALVRSQIACPNSPALAWQVIHINHQLHPDSHHWAAQCQVVCQQLQLPLQIFTLTGAPQRGIEAWARHERRRIWQQLLSTGGGLVLLAQHADDQAETVLQRLCRGSGPRGLGAMRRLSKLGNGYLYRPLLLVSAASLQQFAKQQQLTWVEDPSNQLLQFERNFLRWQVLPQLRARYPALLANIGRTATVCQTEHQLLTTLMQQHLQQCQLAAQVLSIPALLALAAPVRCQVLRLWLESLSSSLPSYAQLQHIQEELLQARRPAGAQLAIADYQLRRYRQALFFLPATVLAQLAQQPSYTYLWDPAQQALCCLPDGSTLTLQQLVTAGCRLPMHNVQLLIVRGSVGRSAKKFFQQRAIPPWERQQYVCVFHHQHLLAILYQGHVLMYRNKQEVI